MAEIDEEQLARELAEEFKKLRVEDVLIQSLVTISQIGYRRLGVTEDSRDARDLDQARLAIATMDALTPVLGGVADGQLVRDFEASVASLKLAYAGAVGSAPGGGASESTTEAAAPEGDGEPAG
ncbi:MAG: hypothetical protein ACE5EV_06000 [Gaiellales bacterium]